MQEIINPTIYSRLSYWNLGVDNPIKELEKIHCWKQLKPIQNCYPFHPCQPPPPPLDKSIRPHRINFPFDLEICDCHLPESKNRRINNRRKSC